MKVLAQTCESESEKSFATQLVSMFLNAKSTIAKECRLNSILSGIAEGRWANQVSRLRDMLANGDEAGYDREKRRILPAFAISGKVSRKKNASHVTEHSGFQQADFDDLPNVEKVRDCLKDDPYVAFGFVSPSGNGLKLGVRIDGSRPEESFKAAQAYFSERYGLEIDPSTKHPAHLCFVSHDPERWINPGAVALPLPPTPTPTTTLVRPTFDSVRLRSTTLRVKPLKDNAVEEALAHRYLPTAPRQNNRLLFEMARAVKALGKAEGQPLDIARIGAVFNYWYNHATPYLRQGQSHEEYFSEFLRAMECVKYPLGEGLLDTAWQQAKVTEPPAEAMVFKDREPRTLICLCQELQRLVGDAPFFLSTRTVQRLFGHSDHLKGYRWLGTLCRLRILQCVERGNRHKANYYRYLLPIRQSHETLNQFYECQSPT